jgi:8-oxo-dGTP pyrophosphatase MutT (NUDIX family)
MKSIEAHGMVIVSNNKLLVTKDEKDDFYKIPGGQPKKGEAGKETATRRLTEETGLTGIIEKKLSTKKLDKNPTTKEPMSITLFHYKGSLNKTPGDYENYEHNNFKVKWIPTNELSDYAIAPNITYLIRKGDIT